MQSGKKAPLSDFDPYLGQFKTASHAGIDWFRNHLS
jgi:hypothetical protein